MSKIFKVERNNFQLLSWACCLVLQGWLFQGGLARLAGLSAAFHKVEAL